MVSAKRKPVDTKRFIHLTGELFADQYYHIYNARLKAARSDLIERSRFRWGEDVKNLPLEQLNATLGVTEVFVIGTLFKRMSNQPSILRELEESQASQLNVATNYTHDDDTLVLHETDENVKVVGDIDVHMHVTGIPVSLLGHQLDGGAKFHITDVCYAGPNLSVYRMPKSNDYKETSGRSRCLLIVSGLEFGFDSKLSKEKSNAVIDALKKLRDLIIGDTDSFDDDDLNESIDKEIVKVIIAGNSIGPGYAKAKVELIGASESNDSRPIYEIFQMFDKYLYTLAQGSANIHVMPGKNDPTSFLLPQQPFHPRILTKSSLLETVKPETNPCILDYEDYTILGTSGENIEAIRNYTRIEFSTTILKNTLEWGHIAPSAPDNLSCVPFKDTDPFIIDFVPDIYFAGNQPEFAVTTYSTETKPKIQLISVPSFVQTLSCVLVDLSNLEAELVTLN